MNTETRNCQLSDIRYASRCYAYFEQINEDGSPVLDSLDVEDAVRALENAYNEMARTGDRVRLF